MEVKPQIREWWDNAEHDYDAIAAHGVHSEEEKELLTGYRTLNEEGRERVRDYIKDLSASGRYIKNSIAEMAEEA